MQIAFIKCHGSGNDFPLIDARGIRLSDGEWATLARLLADREGPVGGDGDPRSLEHRVPEQWRVVGR